MRYATAQASHAARAGVSDQHRIRTLSSHDADLVVSRARFTIAVERDS
jgi:hypothetical protein